MMQWFIFTGLIFRLLNVAIKENVLDLSPKADRNFTESQRNSKQKDGGKKDYFRLCLFFRFQITNSHQFNKDLTQSTSDSPLTPHTMGVSHDAFVSARSTNSNLPAPLSRSCASQNLTSRHGRGTRARLEMSRGNVKQWVSQGSTKGWRVWRTSHRYMIFVDDKGRNYIAFIDRKQEQIKKERGEVVVDLLEPDNCPNE